MKHRIFAWLLTLALILGLLPAVGAKPLTDTEVDADAFGGTLNTKTDLLFDFSNKTTDQTRYKDSAYGGYNFDQESKGYWATGYNDSKSDYTISNTNGTLRVHVTGGADASGTPGPWIKVTNTYGVAPSYSESSRAYYPLNFDPSNVKAVTIKFKLSGCSAPAGEIPKLVFEYYYMKNGSYTYANDMWASFTLDNGYYQTVTIPVSSKLTNADVLKGFGFRFRNVKASNGTIYIDHIYIGADANFVLSSHSDKTFHSQSVNPILSGVNEAQVYLKNNTDGNPIAGYIATIAPSAKVTFKASYPGYYTSGSTVASRKAAAPSLPFKGAKATAQAATYESVTGEKVYLAINADFFDMDTFQPRGQLVMEGNIIQTFGTRATPFFAVLKDGSYAIRAYGDPLADVKEAVAGYHWLVRDGAVVKNNDEELAPRTAIGLKADGTVFIFAADGRQAGYSMGTTLQDLAELMKNAGCVDAINLDGGGSTTFATRYSNGESDLKLRNSPSDSTGERVVTSVLLLVAETCKHKYNTGYKLLTDGTHSVNCSACGQTATMPHSYTNGLCACGEKQHLQGLFFGFSNTSYDTYRYYDPAYNYHNFDTTNNGKWASGYWYTGYTDTTSDYTVNNSAGTLTLPVTEAFSGTVADGNQAFGPWLKISNGDGLAPTKTAYTSAPLYYDPQNADLVQIRFKINDCQIVPDTTPTLYFEYYYEKKGTYTGATDMFTEFSYTDGEYLTVTLPASSTLTSADLLRGFGFRFRNIKSSSGGKITVDYIYIGEAPEETLLFDFDNSSAARQRYQDPAYGYLNFDTASKGYWASYYNGANTNFTVNNSAGTLSVAVTEGYSSNAEGGNIIYGPWIKTTNAYSKFTGRTTYDYYPLSYDPKNAEAFQIRFKTENVVLDTGKTARVVLEYYCTKDGVYTTFTDMIATYTVKNGEYQVVTIPTTKNFKTADEILCFGIRFQHIKSSSKGSVVIDYIAIGKNAALPTPRYTVTFKGADGQTLAQQTLYKRENATYTGATPTKAPDGTHHYSFEGWNKSLENITADTVITATFTASSHSYTYVKSDAANHKASCSCGYSMSEGHSFSYKTSKDPTTSATGTLTGTCSKCEGTTTVNLPKLNTTDYTKTVTKAPTCTETGTDSYKWKTTTYGTFTFTATTAAKGHTSVTDKAVAPTCTSTGLTEGAHCSVCNAVLTAQTTVAALGHNYNKVVTAPTCTAQGYTTHTCSRCSNSYKDSYTNATGHSYAYEKIDVLTHRVYCSNCDAEEITSHVFVDGSCICGEVEIKDPVLDSSLKLSHSLNLASDISINFVVPAYLLEGYDMSTVYVESIIENYEGESLLGTETVRMEPVEMGSYYYFTLTGITAVQMNDTISTILYGEKDGQPYYSNTDLYSVAQYAYSQLNKPNSTDTLKTLCADLLRYGAKAQIYKEYRVSSLADEAMTEEHKSYLSDLEAVTFGNNSADLGDLAVAPVSWVGKTLDLDSKVCLKFVFNVSNYKGELSDLSLKVTYQDIYGETMEVTVTEITAYDPARDRYAFSVDALLASELREVVSVQIFEGETPVSSTFQYSADTYGNNKTGTLLDLCKALFAYSDSAKAYFTN